MIQFTISFLPLHCCVYCRPVGGSLNQRASLFSQARDSEPGGWLSDTHLYCIQLAGWGAQSRREPTRPSVFQLCSPSEGGFIICREVSWTAGSSLCKKKCKTLCEGYVDMDNWIHLQFKLEMRFWGCLLHGVPEMLVSSSARRLFTFQEHTASYGLKKICPCTCSLRGVIG